jgi:hypothetical protein
MRGDIFARTERFVLRIATIEAYQNGSVVCNDSILGISARSFAGRFCLPWAGKEKPKEALPRLANMGGERRSPKGGQSKVGRSRLISLGPVLESDVRCVSSEALFLAASAGTKRPIYATTGGKLSWLVDARVPLACFETQCDYNKHLDW